MSRSRETSRAKRHRRARKKISGTTARPRLAVYRSNKYIYAQVIDDTLGTTLAAASSKESDLAGKNLNIETATEVGKLVADRSKSAGVISVVFDRGGFPFHGCIKALADSAREAGLKF